MLRFLSFFFSFRWFSHMFLASEAVGWGIWSTAGRGYRYSKTGVHVTHPLSAWHLLCNYNTLLKYWALSPSPASSFFGSILYNFLHSICTQQNNVKPTMSVLPLNVFVFWLFLFDLPLLRHGGDCISLCMIHFSSQLSNRMDLRGDYYLRLMQVFQFSDHKHMYSRIWSYIFL